MDAAPIEWIATVSTQLDPDAHGDVTVGIRKGALSASVRTDTLALEWAPRGERGNSWVAVRGHAWATNLIHAPWADGAPAPGYGFDARAVELDVGTVRYLPAGLYAGGRLAGSGLLFDAQPTTVLEVPGPRGLVTADAIAGWWRPEVAVYARGGVDVQTTGTVAPHVQVEGHWAPRWIVAPRIEAWAGWAEGQDFVTRTRLGGLTPWAVPLAGAGWGEFWVEDYAVARLGPSVGVEKAWGFRAGPFVDLATYDGDATAAFGAQGRLWKGRAYLDAAGGWAPWIDRQPGVSNLAAWVSIGMDWGHGWTPANPDGVPGPMGSGWPR